MSSGVCPKLLQEGSLFIFVLGHEIVIRQAPHKLNEPRGVQMNHVACRRGRGIGKRQQNAALCLAVLHRSQQHLAGVVQRCVHGVGERIDCVTPQHTRCLSPEIVHDDVGVDPGLGKGLIHGGEAEPGGGLLSTCGSHNPLLQFANARRGKSYLEDVTMEDQGI